MRHEDSGCPTFLTLPLFAPPALADSTAGEAVEVYADPDAVPASEGSVTVLELGPALPPGQDLASVLDGAPGTTVRQLGGLGSFAGLSVRGSSFRQVEVFVDGVPLNPGGSHAVDLSSLPVTTFQRVELYRGYAPPWFGSDAVGGVVNLVTPDPGPFHAALGAAGGSWGTGHVWASAAEGRERTDILLAVDQLHTEGDFPYFDDRGTDYTLLDDRTRTREHAAIDRTTALARGRVRVGATPLTLLDVYSRGYQELPGTAAAPAYRASYAYDRNLLAFTAAPALGRVHATPRGWWLFREERADDPDAEIGVGADRSRDTYHTAGVDLPVAVTLPAGFGFNALAQLRAETFAPYDVAADAADGLRQRWSGGVTAGAVWTGWADRITARAGASARILDNHRLGDVPFEAMPVAPEADDTEAWVLPRAGLVVRPIASVALRASGGWYVRPPDFLELFGDSGSIVGNTDLVSEHGEGWEAGAHVEHGWGGWFGFALDGAYARRRIHDLITFEANSQQTQHAVNVGEAYVRALEGGLVLCAGDWVDTTTSVTSLLARNLDPTPVYANNQLPGVPPLEVTHTTRVRLPPYAELSHTWSYTSATFADAANTAQQAARNLHSVALGVTPGRGWPTVRAEVLNLLDVRGQTVDRNPLSDDDDTLVVKPLADFAGYPLPGRTVMVAVTWQGPTPPPQKDAR